MILVDSSVWIDFFNGAQTPESDALDALLGRDLVVMGDLILAEVLQGFRNEADYREARALLDPLDFYDLAGRAVALAAAEHHRGLRARGVTVRKTIDVISGSWCLMHGHQLLHADRDFDPLERHLGLRVYRPW